MTNNPSATPTREVLWTATHIRGRRPRFFRAWRWFDAREQAMKSFECGPSDVQVEQS